VARDSDEQLWLRLAASREMGTYHISKTMRRIFGHELAVITIFCVLSIFLFPVSAGPYSAVHGPATGLVAVRAAMKLRRAMALLAFCSLLLGLDLGLATLRKDIAFLTFRASLLGPSLPLRC
jgi:hypothetical protein